MEVETCALQVADEKKIENSFIKTVFKTVIIHDGKVSQFSMFSSKLLNH